VRIRRYFGDKRTKKIGATLPGNELSKNGEKASKTLRKKGGKVLNMLNEVQERVWGRPRDFLKTAEWEQTNVR